MALSDNNTVTARCETAGCPDQGREKTVALTHLGQDVYADPPLRCGRCESGAEMRRV